MLENMINIKRITKKALALVFILEYLAFDNAERKSQNKI